MYNTATTSFVIATILALTSAEDKWIWSKNRDNPADDTVSRSAKRYNDNNFYSADNAQAYDREDSRAAFSNKEPTTKRPNGLGTRQNDGFYGGNVPGGFNPYYPPYNGPAAGFPQNNLGPYSPYNNYAAGQYYPPTGGQFVPGANIYPGQPYPQQQYPGVYNPYQQAGQYPIGGGVGVYPNPGTRSALGPNHPANGVLVGPGGPTGIIGRQGLGFGGPGIYNNGYNPGNYAGGFSPYFDDTRNSVDKSANQKSANGKK